MRQEPEKRNGSLDAEIDSITCIIFVLIIFLIVPFTMLSPFRYPQPSTLDQLLSVNNGPVAQLQGPRVDGRQFAGRFREIDLAIASAADASSQDSSVIVRR
ncbi:MAG: hypothetical protein WD871_04420 [Xanthobacteraceae bacterium]